MTAADYTISAARDVVLRRLPRTEALDLLADLREVRGNQSFRNTVELLELAVKHAPLSSEPPARSVVLTLEETGWLCHLLVREIGPYVMRSRPEPADRTERAVLLRKIELYEKLSDANDRLMGKKR